MPQASRRALLYLLWRKCTLRHWRHAPGASISLTLILALGVAVFFSMRLANRSAVAGFTQFTSTLGSEADLVLTSDTGRLSVQDLSALRRALGDHPAHLVPVLQTTASLPGSGLAADDFDARQLEVVGLDLVAVRNLYYARPPGDNPLPDTAGSGPNIGAGQAAYLGPESATRLGVQADDPLELIIGDQLCQLQVAAVLQGAEGRLSVPANLVLVDLPLLQRLCGTPGRLDRIEIFVPQNATLPGLLDEVRRIASESGTWTVESSNERKASGKRMTAAFRANLTVLSGLALLVGIYLIVQALEASVVRRRPEIAVLLALGLNGKILRAAWLLEALTFGVIGTALGLLMGYAGAQLAVGGVARTVNALYLSTEASRAAWHGGEALLAAFLGIGAGILAGILPARDAALTPPAHILKQGTHSKGIKLLDRPWQGLLMLLAGTLLIQLPPIEWSGRVRFPLAGYAGAVLWLVGMSVVISTLFPVMARLLQPAGKRSVALRVALGQFRRPSGRHKLTVAGLVVAISMAAGMDILIHSFEGTMRAWIGQNLKADLFVACKGVQNASNRNRISGDTWEALREIPGVEAIDVTHLQAIRVDGAPTFLVGARLGRGWEEERFIWLDHQKGPRGLRRLDPDQPLACYLSESFSRRFDRSVGDTVSVPTPAGQQTLRVAGIFADYGNERGTIVADPDYVVKWFGDASGVNAALYLTEGSDPEAIRLRLMQEYPGLAIRTNGTLRAEVLRIFKQTFSITYALKVIGVTVAVAGLILAMISLLLERKRELMTLRELGMSSKQIRSTVMIEGTAVAGLGLVGGLLLSLVLGYILIYVINRQSFGWTLGFSIPWLGMGMLAAGVLAASLISSAMIGRWSARLKGEQEE